MDTDEELAAVDRETGRAYVPAAAWGYWVDLLLQALARIEALERLHLGQALPKRRQGDGPPEGVPERRRKR